MVCFETLKLRPENSVKTNTYFLGCILPTRPPMHRNYFWPSRGALQCMNRPYIVFVTSAPELISAVAWGEECRPMPEEARGITQEP